MTADILLAVRALWPVFAVVAVLFAVACLLVAERRGSGEVDRLLDEERR